MIDGDLFKLVSNLGKELKHIDNTRSDDRGLPAMRIDVSKVVKPGSHPSSRPAPSLDVEKQMEQYLYANGGVPGLIPVPDLPSSELTSGGVRPPAASHFPQTQAEPKDDNQLEFTFEKTVLDDINNKLESLEKDSIKTKKILLDLTKKLDTLLSYVEENSES